MPPANVVYEIKLPTGRPLEPQDRIFVAGRIIPDAEAFSVNFMMKSKRTIAYQMRSRLSGGSLEAVLHNWRNDSTWQNEIRGEHYKLDDDGRFELTYEFSYGKVRVLDGGNNFLYEHRLDPPLREIMYLTVWEAIPKTVLIDEVRFQYSNIDA